MRQLPWWCLLVAVTCACNANEPPLAPTAPLAASPAPAPRSLIDADNWTPWFFNPWEPGAGPSLGANASINGAVEPGELCVSDIYWQWGARACKRFAVSVPSDGWLHGFVHWDALAPGFELKLVGEVVLVQRTGQFATSQWHEVDSHVFARVRAETYDLLVLSYSDDVRLPFRLTTELRAE